jgi:hypothetical protein
MRGSVGESEYRVRKLEIQSTTWCVERVIDSKEDELMAIAHFVSENEEENRKNAELFKTMKDHGVGGELLIHLLALIKAM